MSLKIPGAFQMLLAKAGDTANRTITFPDADITLPTPITAGAWTTYVPSWSGAVSAIGNAGVTAMYWQVGKLVAFRIRVTFGTTTTFAAANMTVSLPVTATASMTGPIGTAVCNLGGTFNIAIPVILSTTTIVMRVTIAGAGPVTNLVPGTWAATHVLDISGNYEAA